MRTVNRDPHQNFSKISGFASEDERPLPLALGDEGSTGKTGIVNLGACTLQADSRYPKYSPSYRTLKTRS
jgi:hypothetical protein